MKKYKIIFQYFQIKEILIVLYVYIKSCLYKIKIRLPIIYMGENKINTHLMSNAALSYQRKSGKIIPNLHINNDNLKLRGLAQELNLGLPLKS